MIGLGWFLQIKRGEEHHQFGRHHHTYHNILGQKFGLLTVIEQQPGRGVLCLCDCGRQHTEENTVNLRNGRRKTCGICNNAGNPKFNAQEDQVIIAMAGIYSTEKIALEVAKIGRRQATIPTIKNRVKKLKEKGYDISLRRKGELYPHAAYSDHDVELCRLLSDEGLTTQVIAEKMEMPKSTAYSFISYRSRKEYANTSGEVAA